MVVKKSLVVFSKSVEEIQVKVCIVRDSSVDTQISSLKSIVFVNAGKWLKTYFGIGSWSAQFKLTLLTKLLAFATSGTSFVEAIAANTLE